MRIRQAVMMAAYMASITISAGTSWAEDLDKQRCPKPAEFALVFSFGYGSDTMPQEDARFDELLTKIKAAGFNVVHCTYTKKRLELCKNRGVKMMLDLLAPAVHHVYKSPNKARAVCEKLRGNPDVWGYNIWNDPFAKSGEGRRRDVNTVREWDPTHPAYSGTYRTEGMSHLVNADILGYYDFHWKRGRDQHLQHLMAYLNWARQRNAWCYTWLAAKSGEPGKGNYNRSLWSANTGIACGLKGILWFLGTEMMDVKTFQWTAAGADIKRVNQEILPMAREIAILGLPTAIYSTPITRTANNEPFLNSKQEMMPPGLENQAFPKDLWIQPARGELVLGLFKDAQGRESAFVANHNAYAEQQVVLRLAKPAKVSVFDCKQGDWHSLEVSDGTVRFVLSPAGGELLRFEP